MGFATSHRLKWSPLLPNEISRIALYVRKGEGRKEGKDGDINHKNGEGFQEPSSPVEVLVRISAMGNNFTPHFNEWDDGHISKKVIFIFIGRISRK